MSQPIKKQQIIGLFGEKAGLKLISWLDPCCNTLCNTVAACGFGPADPNNSIQYNNNGSFFGDALFTRDPVTGETVIASTSGDITLASTGNGSIINTTQGDGTIEFLADGGASPVQFVIDPLLQSIKIQTVGIVAIGDEAGEQNSTHIQIDDTNETVMITNVPSFADDAAATGGGLTTGMLYKTTTGGSTFLKIVP